MTSKTATADGPLLSPLTHEHPFVITHLRLSVNVKIILNIHNPAWKHLLGSRLPGSRESGKKHCHWRASKNVYILPYKASLGSSQSEHPFGKNQLGVHPRKPCSNKWRNGWSSWAPCQGGAATSKPFQGTQKITKGSQPAVNRWEFAPQGLHLQCKISTGSGTWRRAWNPDCEITREKHNPSGLIWISGNYVALLRGSPVLWWLQESRWRLSF